METPEHLEHRNNVQSGTFEKKVLGIHDEVEDKGGFLVAEEMEDFWLKYSKHRMEINIFKILFAWFAVKYPYGIL